MKVFWLVIFDVLKIIKHKCLSSLTLFYVDKSVILVA